MTRELAIRAARQVLLAILFSALPTLRLGADDAGGSANSGVLPQQTLQGFLGMKWGIAMESVRQQMKAQGGFAETAPDEPNCITYAGGKFANLKVRSLKLRFFHNQFFGALVVLEPTNKQDDTLLDLRLALSAKYGDPTDPDFGNGNEALGKIALSWTFEDQNTLVLSTPADVINLYYKSTALSNAWMIESSGIKPSEL